MYSQVLKICFVALAALLSTNCSKSQQNPFEKEILAFEKADEVTVHPDNVILFVGSSSIRMWKSLESDFPGSNVLNRGFGGSQTSDAIYFFDRIVKPYSPEKIFLYEGDNDIAAGKSAEVVLEDVKTFFQLFAEHFPDSKAGFISIKPSPSRWDIHKEMERANAMIRELCLQNDNLEYIDVYTPMIGENGKPVPELFIKDSLHMTDSGYDIWEKVIAPYVKK